MKNQSSYDLHTVLQAYKDLIYTRIFAFCSILIIFCLLLLYSIQSRNTTMEIQEGIASEIIRFHVIANSDSSEDQELKLKVKNALTNALRPILQNAKSIEEARFLLMDNLDDLEALSNKVIKENGYTYTASASLERGFFPLKVYGDLSLPPGEYEALRIELGQAVGKNWWCIMYPPLCFVDATYSVVPEPSKNKLKYILSEEEYNSIISKKNIKVKAKFKLLPWLNN